jgi:hypothetical protein
MEIRVQQENRIRDRMHHILAPKDRSRVAVHKPLRERLQYTVYFLCFALEHKFLTELSECPIQPLAREIKVVHIKIEHSAVKRFGLPQID